MFTPFAFVQTVGGGAGPSYQPLTTAFAAASGISDATTLDALNAFEIGLANYSIPTSSFQAIYPFVGASSGSMKWNFVNTTQYALTYTGSLSFASGGIQAAGSPKNGCVGSLKATNLTASSGHSYFYVTAPDAATGNFQSQIGAVGDFNNPNLTQYYMTWFGGSPGNRIVFPCDQATGAGDGSIVPSSNTVTKGSYMMSRTSASSMKLWKNGTTSLGTNTVTLTGRSYSVFTRGVDILARGVGDAVTCQQRLGWASIGAGLSDTEVANYHTLVSAFQTSMSRA